MAKSAVLEPEATGKERKSIRPAGVAGLGFREDPVCCMCANSQRRLPSRLSRRQNARASSAAFPTIAPRESGGTPWPGSYLTEEVISESRAKGLLA